MGNRQRIADFASMKRCIQTAILVLVVLLPFIPDAGSQTTPIYGLEWPGDGSVRRMLYWHNPFPIYDATYVFKVYPRKKTSGTYKYYTTFFWGNDGTFTWQNGNANTYYGAHPYPIPAPGGPGQWEISVYANDFVTGTEVQWNRWHTQVFRAWRESSSITHHEFYYDWPDTSKVISKTINDSGWANQNPPTPAIVVGQAPNFNGASWGGYPGWEEFNGVIRGIQIYSGLLSLSEVQAEINAPKSTTAGQNNIWYLNLNPRPGDVSDKKGIGSAHNPAWAGTSALEWSDQASAPDASAPSIPTNLTASAVSESRIDLSWVASTDNVGVTGYFVERCESAGCTNFTQIATTASASYVNTGLTANTQYSYRVRATDAAGNRSAYSSVSTAITPGSPNDSVAPSNPSSLSATPLSASQISLKWTASTDNAGVSNYLLERCQGAGCVSFAQIASPGSTAYNDAGVASGSTYSYRVRARDASGNTSGYSNTATATTPVPSGGTGPVAAYSFNEGSGATAADGSGNGWTGSLANGPAWATGRNGHALSFDGGDDKVALPANFDIPALPFTLEAWVRPANYSNWRVIFSKRNNYSSQGMRVDVGLQISTGRVYTTTSSSTVTFNYAPPLNAWTHLAVVADPSGTALYVNGVLQQILGAVTLGTSSTAAVNIGRTGDNDDPFAGSIDDLRVYRRALSQPEIANDMNTPVASDTNPPGVPTDLAVSVAGSNQLNLTWTPSTDDIAVTVYRLERCQGAGCSDFVQVAAPSATSYTDTNLLPGTSYSYRVRASDGAGNVSGYSSITSATTGPSVPSNLTARPAGSNAIDLSWGASNSSIGIANYAVERCEGNGCSNFMQVATPVETSYQDPNLNPGASYSYRVRSRDKNNNLSGYSNTATTTTGDTSNPSNPTNLTAVAGATGQIQLSWSASTDNTGVTGYRLERCQNANCAAFAQIASPTATSYTDGGLTSGTSYSYRVRAVDGAGNLSGYSNIASATTSTATPPGAPGSLTAVPSGATSINLSWSASSSSVGIAHYLVERCQNAGCSNFVQIATVTTTAFANSGLASATTYSYRVRARDTNNALSAYSNTAAANTSDANPPTVPANLAASASGATQINLSWSPSTDNVGVSGYLLERCQGSGCTGFSQVATPASTSYSDTNLAAGTSYSYRVRARDAAGNLSGFSNVAGATIPTGSIPIGAAAAYAFGEGSGTGTGDASGNGWNGVLVGSTWGAGRYGNGLVFDGVNDKVALPSSLDIPALPFTLEAWVRPTSYSNWRVIFSKRNRYSGSDMRFDVGLHVSTGRVYMTTYWSTVVFSYTPPLNAWTHLAVVATPTGSQLYVNGVLRQTLGAVTLGTSASAAVNIGFTGDNEDPFAGSIDDLRLYRRALSASEIQTDMNTPVGP